MKNVFLANLRKTDVCALQEKDLVPTISKELKTEIGEDFLFKGYVRLLKNAFKYLGQFTNE